MQSESLSPATSGASPVTTKERFVSLDVLRGVAILGILVMNIYAFAMPFAAYMNPLKWGGTDALNLGTWMFTHVVFDQKFLSIFAMLFGAGMVLLSERAEAKGVSVTGIFYRRQCWLLLIGVIHGYFIWVGDILFMYAAIGMLAYLFRRLSPKALITIAICLLPIAWWLNMGFSYVLEETQGQAAEVIALQEAGEEISDEQQLLLDDWEEMRAFMLPNDDDLMAEVDVYRGDYAGIVEFRVPIVISFQLFGTLFFGLWRVLALMLIGMALMKLGVLSLQREANFYRTLMLAGYGVGLPLTMFSAYTLHAHSWDAFYLMRSGALPNYVGSIVVALGHIGAVMWLLKTGRIQSLLARFAAVGRMAFTNYLSHSIILTSVFYGYGIGLFGSVDRFPQMAFVVAVIGFQLWFSPWWLERFRFGPAEWLWRSLTYWRRQPMRRTSGDSAESS